MKPLIAVLLLSSLAFGCGSERWSVKTLKDRTFEPSMVAADPGLATVGALRNLARPAKLPNDARAELEYRYVYTPAVIRGFKLEADGDFHVVIAAQNKPNDTLIAEVPDPACANSQYAKQFAAVRAELAKLGTPKGTGKMLWLAKSVPVVIEGLIFFDKLHGQTGVAPNGVEIHPVLKLDVQETHVWGLSSISPQPRYVGGICEWANARGWSCP